MGKNKTTPEAAPSGRRERIMIQPIDVNYGSLTRYDTTQPPLRQRKIFTAILRALCGVSMTGQEYKIEKTNMENLKPPYIRFSNHM